MPESDDQVSSTAPGSMDEKDQLATQADTSHFAIAQWAAVVPRHYSVVTDSVGVQAR